ncbi:MAG: hypothetical protein HLUCCA12_03335 [Rhodobacteraceae bacterium HLUCCA12]|nr:MAG: hypothetical protein HLUCCA12_03335 [Rhodobacteraceae bacterium HLUCCA12]
MARNDEQEQDHRRQVRLIAGVLVVTMVVWMIVNWAGGYYGWQARYAFLFDFMALAAFGWALIVSYRLWRARRDQGGDN